MNIRPLIGGIALCSLAGAAHAQANLLVNGSFEAGTFAPQGNQTMTLAPGATAMTGWTVVNDSIAWIGVGDPWGLDASDGDRFLDLSDYSAGAPFGGVSQSFATTPGYVYTLTFDLGSSNFWGRPSALVVTAGGTSQTFTSPLTGTNNDWQTETLSFVASAAMSTVSFVGASGVNYIGLDNVSITAVPEPATALLWLAGVGLLAGLRRPAAPGSRSRS